MLNKLKDYVGGDLVTEIINKNNKNYKNTSYLNPKHT